MVLGVSLLEVLLGRYEVVSLVKDYQKEWSLLGGPSSGHSSASVGPNKVKPHQTARLHNCMI